MKPIIEYLLSKDKPKSNGVAINRIKPEEYEGGSFHDDVILISVDELTKIMGKPNDGDGFKVRYAWFCEYDGIQFEIYDWKLGRFTKKEKIELHIGTKEEKDSKTIMEYFKSIGLNAYHLKYPWS